MSRKWDIGVLLIFCVCDIRLCNYVSSILGMYYTDIYYYIENHNHFFQLCFKDMICFILFNYLPSLKFNTKKNLFQKSQPRCQSRRGFHLGKYDTCRSIFANATLQGINISHLGKRKIIFKMPFLGDMLVSWRVIVLLQLFLFLTNRYSNFANLSFLLQVVVPWVCLKRFINFVVDRNIAHSNKFTNHPLAWPKEEKQLPKSSMFSSWNTLKSTCS